MKVSFSQVCKKSWFFAPTLFALEHKKMNMINVFDEKKKKKSKILPHLNLMQSVLPTKNTTICRCPVWFGSKFRKFAKFEFSSSGDQAYYFLNPCFFGRLRWMTSYVRNVRGSGCLAMSLESERKLHGTPMRSSLRFLQLLSKKL